MDRRQFLTDGVLAAGAAWVASRYWPQSIECISQLPPTHSIIPVVGDGKWIWTEPPKGQTGYLEPRSFELSIGVELEGQGNASQIRASTPVPVEHAEQQIDDVRLETDGCEASIQSLGEGAAQLVLAAPGIARGQTVRALARYRLTLKKQYHGYAQDQFPAEQPAPSADIRKLYLHDSPGIQTSSAEVRKLLGVIRGQAAWHPWDLAEACCRWGRENIKPQVGQFSGVTNALQRRVGDCEEMAAVFVALCRAAGIPARLVWVPNHNWAEFYLTDRDGRGHWIPAHTACYSWFGWTGVHELVIQKGDRLAVPHESKLQRLVPDWAQWSGKRPTLRYVAELKPVAADDSSDPGPGARSKQTSGEWKLDGNHPLQHYMRSA